jgi:hypothetical protein
VTPAGYMAKKVETRPEWLKAGKVAAIYSVSGCISKFFCDYIDHWKHNGYWFFDDPALIAEVAEAASTPLAGHQLFYYEVYEKEFEEGAGIWTGFAADEAFATNVVAPPTKRLEGYDVVTFSAHTSPECSPLSCNHLAAEGISVNEHCLLPSLEEAIRLVEARAFAKSEPGPYRIFAVYSVEV